MDNIKNKTNDAIFGYFYLIFGLNTIGFLVWTLYQLASKEIDLFGSMPLLGFLYLWWAFLFLALIPQLLLKLIEMALLEIKDKQKQDELIKLLN